MTRAPRSAGTRWRRRAAAAWVVAWALGGCHRGDAKSVADTDTAAVIEARDAFHDAVRAPDGSLMIVGRYGKILRSTNDGTSWQSVASGETRALFSLAFADAQRAVAVGAQGLMLESADGGLTWQPRPALTDRQLFRVRFPAPPLGFVVGEFGTLLRSDDAGQSWTVIELPWDEILPSLAEQLGTVEPHLYDIAFCDAERGWAVGEYGLILATRDGGQTWTKQHGGALSDPHLFTAECTGAGTVVAAGQSGQIVYSADAGRTWSEERGGVQDVYDLVVLRSDRELLAIGDLGALRLSSSAGQPGTWKDIAIPGGSFMWAARGIWIGHEILLVGQSGARRVALNGSLGLTAQPSGHSS
jgi:photosystem II stability/assembly factor-like uncharacterized protein